MKKVIGWSDFGREKMVEPNCFSYIVLFFVFFPAMQSTMYIENIVVRYVLAFC